MRLIYLITAIIICIGNLYSQVNLDSGLVAYYPFNGNANDESGNGNNGIVTGAVLSSDRFNIIESAYSFNGNGDFIDIGFLSQLNGSLELSISIWVKKDSANRREGFIGKWRTATTNDNVFLLYNNEPVNFNKPRLVIQLHDNSIAKLATQNFAPVGDWFHLVVTWRSSDGFFAIYMNNILENSVFDGQGKSLSYHELFPARIGHWGAPELGEDYYFLGSLDDIRIYNRALTTDEVDSLFNEQPSPNYINSTSSNINSEFALKQNYPNPFNPNTQIRYSIPQSSNVVIKVFDILGNEIEALVNEEKPSGTYELNWNEVNLPSGVYFYRIQAGSFIETKKMVLLR
ncbi:MAG: T9SS type A sorting domain-containing protein [Ignavibacteriaceae bacterium]|nr:T9SS type A sorting domain-containing protein [Ignavibacteriaceae bacterium]